MESEVWEIVKALDSKKITAIEAHKKICDLYIISGSLPSREDAYKEGLSRKRRHEKNIVWKAKIFAAGAMWAKMKLTGISDVIGNDR